MLKRLAGIIICLAAFVSGADITAFKTNENSWSDAFDAARKTGRLITLPSGRYELERTLEVSDGLTVVFEDGAELCSAVSPVIRHTGGTLVLQGYGLAGIVKCTSAGERGYINPKRGAAIDMNEPSKEKPPTLILRNIELQSFNGIDGYWAKDGNVETIRNDIAALEISNCRFLCSEKGVAFRGMAIGRVRIENSYFVGADSPIWLNVPMPGGAQIINNELSDFGRSGIMLGKAGQVADGCTTHLPNAVVQGNRLLKGGRGAKVTDSYTQGILVYGNNVVVEGNIVRDVNRGVPVPGEPIGHQIIADDGTALRGHWVERDGKKVRLAGAAIYLKANRSIVMGNICTNSGYRSVIEIKTGGKEPFVSVCNNVVDGRSLDIDESFGFECNSGRSIWMNNVVFDMPHEAFVVRSGFENTFTNNLIVNAKVGFGLAGRVPGEGEWINGNRFINVKMPVAIDGKEVRPANVPEASLPGPVFLDETAELPNPSQEWNGRMIVRGKNIYLGVVDNGTCKWMEFSGKVIEPKKYHPVGPELAFNCDQAGTKQSLNPLLNDAAFPGWIVSMRTANEKPLDAHDGFVTFDKETFKTGGRAMKVMFPAFGAEWSAKQPINVIPGRRYRGTALVKGEEPRNIRLCVNCGKAYQTRAEDSPDWQLLSVDFVASSSVCDFMIIGSKTSPEKSSWVDSISLRELAEEGVPDTNEMHTVGENLLVLTQSQVEGKLPKGWNIAGIGKYECASKENGISVKVLEKGNCSMTTAVKLQPGIYRFVIAIRQDAAKFKQTLKLPDGSRPAGISVDGVTWQCDFTVKEAGSAIVGIWGGNIEPNETFTIDSMSLKTLE